MRHLYIFQAADGEHARLFDFTNKSEITGFLHGGFHGHV